LVNINIYPILNM